MIRGTLDAIITPKGRRMLAELEQKPPKPPKPPLGIETTRVVPPILITATAQRETGEQLVSL